jgi:uncharacterized membrane protein YtjA (UPF0391 family)
VSLSPPGSEGLRILPAPVKEETDVLRWAIAFAIIAIIAAVLGFGGLSNTAADIAKFFALVFVVLFVIALVVGRSVIGGPTV